MPHYEDKRLPAGCEPSCPGCAHRAMSAADSEAQKQAWLARTLAAWQTCIEPIQAPHDAQRLAYRDKVCLKAEWRDQRWQIGMNLNDEVLAIPDCPVHSARVRCTLHALLERLPGAECVPMSYFVQNGAQVTLVLKSAVLPDTRWFDQPLRHRLVACGVEGLWLHLHPAVGKKIFNKPGWHLLWGAARSRDAGGFVYGPTGFHQLIPGLYRHALDRAQAFLAPSPDTVIVDLYSGNGKTLSRWLAAGAAAIGVELGAEACESAASNAPQAPTLRGKCEQRLPQLDQWVRENRQQGKTRLLYLNPPRTGLEHGVRRWIMESYRPARMAYLSCSAGTLRRDLGLLSDGGYQVERIIPYDFFPHTYHVETLVLLGLTG